MKSALAFALSIALVAIACGSEDGAPSAPNDAGSTSTPSDSSTSPIDGSGTTPTPDSGTPSATCNDVVNDAPFVDTMKVAGTAPAPAGGAIAEGRYYLTAVNAYTAGNVASLRRADTMVVTGNVFESVTTFEASGAVYRAKSTFTINGNLLSGTSICYFPAVDGGVAGSATNSFTATATELRSYITVSTTTTEFVYTKQ